MEQLWKTKKKIRLLLSLVSSAEAALELMIELVEVPEVQPSELTPFSDTETSGFTLDLKMNILFEVKALRLYYLQIEAQAWPWQHS